MGATDDAYSELWRKTNILKLNVVITVPLSEKTKATELSNLNR